LKTIAGRGGLGLSFAKTVASCLLNSLNLAPLNFYPGSATAENGGRANLGYNTLAKNGRMFTCISCRKVLEQQMRMKSTIKGTSLLSCAGPPFGVHEARSHPTEAP
jgi:hypothetical protein